MHMDTVFLPQLGIFHLLRSAHHKLGLLCTIDTDSPSENTRQQILREILRVDDYGGQIRPRSPVTSLTKASRKAVARRRTFPSDDAVELRMKPFWKYPGREQQPVRIIGGGTLIVRESGIRAGASADTVRSLNP